MGWFDLLHLSPLSFDVGFDVGVSPHQTTTNHTNRGFGAHGTLPDAMKHDETTLWARDYETAALPLIYAGLLNEVYPNLS